MAVDIFLKLDKIEGEAMDHDAKHKDTIDVLAWGWDLNQSGTTHVGSGSGGGKVDVGDLRLTKWVEKSSPTLMQKLCDGTHIAKGWLTIRKAGGGVSTGKPLEYVKIELHDILVTHIGLGGTGSGDRLTEDVKLNFAKFKYIYTQQNKDGSAGKEVEGSFDMQTNKSF